METKVSNEANRLVKSAGYVVYKKDPQHGRLYLLIEQSKSPHRWTPPKGRVENGETEIRAAIRELKEETGLIPDDVNVIITSKTVIKSEKNNHLEEITFWVACLHSEKIVTLSSEHLQYKWLPLKEALEISDHVIKQALEHSDNYLTKFKH